MAQSILDDCPRPNGAGLLFAGERRVERDGKLFRDPCELAGWSKLKARLDKAIMEIRREDAEKAGADPDEVKPLAGWTIHDLRRTAATGMQSLGFSDEVIDRVLNHVLSGVRRAYNRFPRDAEKKVALDAWALHVGAVVSGEPAPSNVIEWRNTLAASSDETR